MGASKLGALFLAASVLLLLRALAAATGYPLWLLATVTAGVIGWGFLAAWNRGVCRVGAAIALVGATLNAIVIWANGGYMPVAVELYSGVSATHVPMTTGHRLAALADVLPPGGASVGDYILALGLVVMLTGYGYCRKEAS